MLPVQGKAMTGVSFLPDGRLVSLGTTATVWQVALQPIRAGTPVLERELSQKWERLGDPDPEKAWPAMGKLAGMPAEVVDLIRNQVHAVPKLDSKALDRILRKLDADEFKDREAASEELDRLGVPAVPRVKARLAEGASAEVKRRLEVFLAEHDRGEPSPDTLRSLRAVEILEAVDTPAARKVLGDLAAGEPTAALTREAAAAVQRVGRR
jgi:hypothetical protein